MISSNVGGSRRPHAAWMVAASTIDIYWRLEGGEGDGNWSGAACVRISRCFRACFYPKSSCFSFLSTRQIRFWAFRIGACLLRAVPGVCRSVCELESFARCAASASAFWCFRASAIEKSVSHGSPNLWQIRCRRASRAIPSAINVR